MSEIEFRLAEIQDANDILMIDREYEYECYSLNSIQESLCNNYTYNFLAQIDGKSVGYISFTIIFEECNILKIVVARDCREMGIASALMQYTMQFVKNNGAKEIFLEVRKNNFIAKKFYEKNGFKLKYERKKYYDDGEDADIYYFYL